MVLYSIIDEADVFADAKNSIMPTQYVDIAGGKLEYRVYNGEKQVVRLHSTDPYLYLKNEYSPYTGIN